MSFSASTLKPQLTRELKIAGIARTRNRHESGAPKRPVRIIQRGRIAHIESLGADLKIHSRREPERLPMLNFPSREVNNQTAGLPAAWQVQSGTADCCIATRAAARVFGLHFIPLLSERYDLVMRKEHLNLPRMQNLLDALGRSDFRRELEASVVTKHASPDSACCNHSDAGG